MKGVILHVDILVSTSRCRGLLFDVIPNDVLHHPCQLWPRFFHSRQCTHQDLDLAMRGCTFSTALSVTAPAQYSRRQKQNGTQQRVCEDVIIIWTQRAGGFADQGDDVLRRRHTAIFALSTMQKDCARMCDAAQQQNSR
jgi:hypothetical protein